MRVTISQDTGSLRRNTALSEKTKPNPEVPHPISPESLLAQCVELLSLYRAGLPRSDGIVEFMADGLLCTKI